MTHFLHFVWNPSEGFEIGSFTLRFYSLMFVIAFTLGFFLMKKIFEREGESMEKLDSLFMYMFLSILLGARLGHVLFYQTELITEDPLSILLPFRFNPTFEFTGFQGLASHGAAIAVIVTMYFYTSKILKRPMLWILDRVVIPVASGAILVRLGNFFNSEIVGDKTTSPFGIKFVQDAIRPNEAIQLTKISNSKAAYNAIATDPNFASILDTIPAKHPSQLYEAFGYVFVFFILLFLYWKTDARLKQGYLFGMFLVMLFSVRIVVEFVKESQGGFESALGLLSTGQWLSIPFVIVGLYFVIKAKKVVV
ncbi:prolipoprotein diacylglyceryl transferase [Flavobacterium sp.]|uniref:prolipoprotein diacylglyceryl transferase n=1 Tax=Flavobacterium sp. TaxID=239 RepID=UPI00286E5F2B|nr:prolipoprotein diacylglyceryl transferase [Flavobacterium sp.]